MNYLIEFLIAIGLLHGTPSPTDRHAQTTMQHHEDILGGDPDAGSTNTPGSGGTGN